MDLTEARIALNGGADVAEVLWRVWHLLEGGDEHGMTPLKTERASNLTWRDPIATFEIERHLKSGRQTQTWRADLLRGTAERVTERELRPETPLVHAGTSPLRAEGALAAELASLIRDGEDDRRLNWRGNRRGEVKVLVSSALGGATSEEAKRLKDAIAAELGDAWTRESGLFVRLEPR